MKLKQIFCRHKWVIYKESQLPMMTTHTYEECKKCLKKQDYYTNPMGKFKIK